MSSESNAIETHEELRVLDPGLPFLASKAAIYLENQLSNGGGGNSEPNRGLARQLKGSLQVDDRDGSSRLFRDPGTATVLEQAINEIARKESRRKFQELLDEAGDLADLLLKESPTKEELTRARDFCLALATAAIAYRRSIRDARPQHRYRR